MHTHGRGVRTFFKSSSPSHSPPPPHHHHHHQQHHHHTFSESLMEENIELAHSLITKWDPPSPNSTFCNISYLFRDNPSESSQYLNAVNHLQTALHYYAEKNPTSDTLVRAQSLMQTAMKRLQREFHQILSSNRHSLDSESVSNSDPSSRSSVNSGVLDMVEETEGEAEPDDEMSTISDAERSKAVAMTDLKAIADCMIASGYGKECFKVYKTVRKSIVHESLCNLKVERLNFSAVSKMDWKILETKIKNWLMAVNTAVKTIFYGERTLCDNVFSVSESIRESCFSEICKDSAMILFGFPEMVARCKKSPEKMFRTLDLYEAISNLWPEIDSIFSFESTSEIRSVAVAALHKLGEAVRTMLAEFETAVQQDADKTPLPGGGIHPLTRYVMNYIQFLSDYSEILADILADWPMIRPLPLPDSYFENSETTISMRFAWLILVLLCKIDARAELFKDVSLSYLFLANNLQYVIVKVRSSKLKHHLGDDWIQKHEAKVNQYATSFERMGWSTVLSSMPENLSAEISPAVAKDCFRRFNAAFEDAYKKQRLWMVQDSKLRDEIKVSLATKLVPAYREFYRKNRARVTEEIGAEVIVRFAPDDLENYLSDILHGASEPGSVSSSSSRSSFSWSHHMFSGRSH